MKRALQATGLVLTGACSVVLYGLSTNARAEETAASKRLAGGFGEMVVDVQEPCVRAIFLRQPDGLVGVKSILCERPSEFPDWAVGGVTYVRGIDDVHYISRHSVGQRVVDSASPAELTISGLRLRSSDGRELPAAEDWEFRVEADGGLSWTVRRTWNADFQAKFVGEPALYFNSRPNAQPTASGQKRVNPAGNGVMASWWVQSDELIPESRPEYKNSRSRTWFNPPHSGATMKQNDGWATFKLYTSFPHLADLRCKASSGHLYRRGSYNAFTEIGLTPQPGATLRFAKGDVVTTTLRLQAVPQSESGQQLIVDIPDREMLTGLQSFFGGLANSGALCDQVNHYFGNECDGFQYAGNMWMHAYSLLASLPAAGSLSVAPVGYPEAFRKNLIAVLKSVNDRGEVMFGFRHPQKDCPELPLIAMIALEADLLYTGDASLACAHREEIRRMARYVDTWCVDDLFYIPTESISDPTHCPNWYYDGVRADGYILYHNLLRYRAMGAMETIYSSLGEAGAAREVQQRRQRSRSAINRLFWCDDAYGPGRGGYLDWIRDRELKQSRAYFFSCMQYMAIVFGVADEEQSREILRTADHLIAALQRDRGYTHEATLDNLLPIPPGDVVGNREFGMYMNGGMLLAMTFWEVTARCRAGDAKGANELLSRFAAHARRTNWFEGENAFAMDGRPLGWNNEPYLADQIVGAAALVHGFLGLSYSADDFQVTPHLPPDWDKMSAEIQFKGRRYRVTAFRDGRHHRELVTTSSAPRSKP
jgi:hypothetical protein